LGRKKTGYIQKRGDSFRIAYHANGRRQFETFKDRDEAERALARRLADAADGIPVSSRPNTVLFGELCTDVRNEYLVNKRKSLASLDSRMEKHIVPFFGLRKASQITTALINSYILHRESETPKPSDGTISRELQAIRHVFMLAKKGGKILHMPYVTQRRETNVRQGFFTAAEVERLCSHLTPMLGLFVRFAFLTGWRKSEISGLKWSNVDLVANEIRLEPGTTKSGEGRVFPITGELREVLASASTLASQDRAAKRIVDRKKVATLTPRHCFEIDRLPIGDIRKSWLTAMHKAGLPCVYDAAGKKAIKALRIFHDLRRSAAKRFVQAGLSQSAVMALCGWQTPEIFHRYQVLTVDDLRASLEGMEGPKEPKLAK